MKKVDFAIQILLLTVAVVLAITIPFESDSLAALLIVQLAMGAIQTIGAVISLCYNRPLLKHRLIHLGLAAICCVIIAYQNLDFNEFFKVLYLTAFPWMLAIYYLFITWKSLFPKKYHEGHFLPHTSF